ncbi:putative DNA binding domain-containing protein [Bifidobacterium pullorum]|uniref:RNA-binding domain-containing protein n=1 Tax=Bifidobacterium pullorum TaxID=78448 RepID=UPI0025A47DC9|nr:RNA-binding domain-containing protein [Bifidobacterium pullorum]MDM8322765.1 putative DNA binding domain-containing protein [Bifidobacterium pullorum]
MAKESIGENLALLARLIENWEDETVEFKEASNDFDTDKIGRYVSALSNEANLADIESGWLVFGVKNKTRQVVGTEYGLKAGRFDLLKRQINDDTDPSMTFRSIRVVEHPNGRVVMFEIPAAPKGMPIAWKGHWYARAGENLISLSVDKLDAIRGQGQLMDWTAQVVADAELSDLSAEAIEVARRGFTEHNASRIPKKVIESWNDEEFLRHAGLITKRGITRACILLLGKPEAANLLTPLMAELTWKLVGQETAYEHFGLPFILATSKLYTRIRNIRIRLLPPNELIQREVEKYDQSSVLEAMHNCIAHQDYTRFSRISVTEYPDHLEFISVGSFFEGEPDEYALEGRMPRRYRNPVLVQAMTQLNMIDHLGYGIERMNRSQANRYLPLPDYDLSNPGEVKLTIYGCVVDEGYTKLLMQNSGLPFEDILALDRVQKGHPISDQALRRLRNRRLVEGRRPHLRVAAAVAEATGTQVNYLQVRGQSDEYCCAAITDYLKLHGRVSRDTIDSVVFPLLSTELSDDQRRNKVKNLLSKLKREGAVQYTPKGGDRGWSLR